MEDRGNLKLECFVEGGEDWEIAEAIWPEILPFCGTVGNHTVTLSLGQTISFSREGETMGSGHAATVDSMRDALLRVPGVTSARVEERGKLDLEVFVAGGDDQQVAEAIWCAKAAFIGTVGNHSVQMPYGPISFSREGETTAYRQDTAEEEVRVREITGALLQAIKGVLKRGAEAGDDHGGGE